MRKPASQGSKLAGKGAYIDVSDRRRQVQLTQEAKIASDFSLFRAIFAFAGFVSALGGGKIFPPLKALLIAAKLEAHVVLALQRKRVIAQVLDLEAEMCIRDRGGYMLSRPPGEITVGQVLRALEGGLNLLECLSEEDACGKSCDCPSRKVWKRLRDGLNEIVDGITLEDMLRRDEE